MRNRFNVCSETAVTKAAAIIYHGLQLTYVLLIMMPNAIWRHY